MNWKICLVLLGGFLQLLSAEETTPSPSNNLEKSPYVELFLCLTKDEMWECAKEQTSKLLSSWNTEILDEWDNLKENADKEMNTTSHTRGFSSLSDLKEKPSIILNKIQLGAKYIRDLIEETTKEIIGRKITYDAQDEDDFQDTTEEEEEEQQKSSETDLEDNNSEERKKGQISGHPVVLTLGSNTGKKKKKPLHHLASALTTHGGHHDLAWGHLSDSLLSSLAHGHGIKFGHKHGIKIPQKYGRSIGVQRGKKKKKKILMKLILLATLVKGKIELLLKILSAHLQIKFFAVALIGLLINVARFWIDLRRGIQPQKVIYYEHSHHQHHYDEHPAEEWGSEPQSGYWKRSLSTDPDNSASDASDFPGYFSSSDGITTKSLSHNPHRLVYRRQIPKS